MAGVALVALSGLASTYLQVLRSPAAYASTTCTVTATTDDSSVTTAGTLSGCLNDLTTAPAGPFTILLNTSVTLGPGGLAAVDPTNQVDITIDGQGNTIDGQGAANVRTRPGFAFTLEATDTLTVTDVTLTDMSAPRKGGALLVQDGTSVGFDVTLDGITIQDSYSSNRAGAVYVDAGDLTIRESQFVRNDAISDGGAVYVETGDLTITDSEFVGNEANGSGGAVYVWNGNVSVTGSRFEANASDGDGGALYAETLSTSTNVYAVTISSSDFISNAAGDNGGAIYVGEYMARLSVTESTFVGNRTAPDTNDQQGGAIYVGDGPGSIDIYATYFSMNYAGQRGGAIYSDVPLTITNSVFVDDSAIDEGGAVAQRDDTLVVRGSLFVGNESVDQGGAVWNLGDYVTKVYDSVFLNNRSGDRGGAIYGHYAVQVYRSTFIGNQSADDGGAVKSGSRENSSLAEYPLVADSYFKGNVAGTEGGAISWENGDTTDPSSITVLNSSFTGNTAPRGGAMFRPRSSSVSELGTVIGSTFANNTADDTGGAIWDGGSLAITNTTLVSNVATTGGGGAIYMDDSSIGAPDTLLLDFVTLSANDAPAGRGAAMWLVDTAVTAAMSVIDDTNATPDPCEFVGSTTMDDTSVFGTQAQSCQLNGLNSDATWAVGSFLFGALADNGGLTDTLMPPLSSPLATPSPATNQNLSVGAVGVDQRGAIRVAPFTLGAVQQGASGAPGGSNAPIAAAGDAEATVTAPTTVNGGTPTSWVIQAFNADDTELMATDDTCTITAASGSCTVTGLTNGSAYQFTAVSANALGSGRVSPVSNTVTPAANPGPAPVPPTPPAPTPAGPPRDVVAVGRSGGVGVSWAPPASSGAFPVSMYRATATPGGRTCLVPAASTSCEITGLTNGVSYVVSVEALTGAGWSPAASSNPVIPGGVTPAPAPAPLPQPLAAGVSLLLVNGVPDTSVRVDPNSSDNGLQITGDDWSMDLDGLGPDGQPLALGPNGALRLLDERDVATTGTGFLPNSDVDLYVDPPVEVTGSGVAVAAAEAIFVGTVRTDAQGRFSGTATLPADIAPGEHVLQAVGYSPTAQVRAMSLGVIVDPWIVLDEGTRQAQGRLDRIRTGGETGGVDAGTRLTPWIRYSGQKQFQQGKATIRVQADGSFTWTRKIRANRGLTAYVSWTDVESNRVFWKKVR